MLVVVSAATCDDLGPAMIPLQKRYGQHHLRNGSICDPLLGFLRPAGRRVLEIGPGGGVLTRLLLAAGARVVAVEIDPVWGLSLVRQPDLRATTVVVADALDLAWQRLPVGTLVTGNLPFNVGTALIERLLQQGPRIPRAGFLVQKEVAERLLAEPGESAYGSLSVLTAARCKVTMLGRVRRGSFHPPPRVDGAFVGLEPQPAPLGEEEMIELAATVRLAFAQRRKQLRNALAAGWGRQQTLQALAAAEIDSRQRAQDLSLDQFLRLHQAHRAGVDSTRP